ncbi:hypothetical protein CIW82_07570 [Acetobacter tropicalis]|uniref:Uncharacterized protein n=3 Tax=Acetobacter TaxID=434 RepID=A0A291PGQ3_9PROT|nr:hypothetical protein CIW82_07570 [Acetobacter tropicalis]
MADGSVQQSDKNQPNGVAGLDAAGRFTAPVAGDVTAATAGSALSGALKRPLSARFAEQPSAGDFGITLDGTSDDSTALQAAKAAVPAGSMVRIPAGVLHLATPLQSETPTLWQINGTTLADGAPITSLGTDVIESTLEGGKYFARGESRADMPPVLRKDLDVTHTGGTTGFVMNLEKGNCTIPAEGAALNDYVWCHSTVLNSSAFGAGQHVAQASLAQRPADALADGKGSRSQIWAGYDEARDETGQASSVAGSMVGREVDVYANGDDPVGWRIGLQLQIAGTSADGTPGKVGKGIAIGNNDATSTYGTLIDAAGRFDTAGIDLSRSTPVNNAPVLNIGANRNLAFSDDHKPHFQFDSAAYTLRYWYDTANLLAIGMQGDVTTSISNAGSGVAWTLSGQAQLGLNLSGLNAPEALRLAAGQTLSWEPTAVVHSGFANGKLTEQVAAGVARTLDTSGNETLPGSLQNSQTIVSLTQPTAPAYVAKGTAAIGLDTTGLTTPEALRVADGQAISWEHTASVQTRYASGQLQDSQNGTPLRTLDASGNETVTGSTRNSGMTTSLNNSAASAITLTGSAGIGVNLTGLSTSNALRLGDGQSVAWEPTAVMTTGYTATGLTDAKGSTPLRQLDSNGNETLAGTITPNAGVHLPTLSRASIKAQPNPAPGVMVFDAEDDAPAIYTSAGWMLVELSAMP